MFVDFNKLYIYIYIYIIPFVFQIRCCCQTTRILISVLVIQLRHGSITSCPPPQDIPYYKMSMSREITFLQITCHSVSMLFLIMQLNVCMILVVTRITIICPLLTYFITLMSSIILWELINSYIMCLHRWIFLNLSQWLI